MKSLKYLTAILLGAVAMACSEKEEGEPVFASTLVVGGRAHVVVTEIGAGTKVGKLGKALPCPWLAAGR